MVHTGRGIYRYIPGIYHPPKQYTRCCLDGPTTRHMPQTLGWATHAVCGGAKGKQWAQLAWNATCNGPQLICVAVHGPFGLGLLPQGFFGLWPSTGRVHTGGTYRYMPYTGIYQVYTPPPHSIPGICRPLATTATAQPIIIVGARAVSGASAPLLVAKVQPY